MEISLYAVQKRVPVTIMRVKGRIDASTVDDFNLRAENAVKDGVVNILLDLSEVEFISSIGVRSIGTLYDNLHPGTAEEKQAIHQGIRAGNYKAPHLKLLNPSDRVMDLFRLVSLDMYLDIFTNESMALEAFGA